MKRFSKPILALVIGALSLVMFQGAALAQTVQVDYTWTAPTSGSTVDHYVIQHSVNGGAWTQVATSSSNTYTLTATVGEAHRLRVAGVDSQDRMGTYSSPSDSYTPDLGPPGQPGKPIIF